MGMMGRAGVAGVIRMGMIGRACVTSVILMGIMGRTGVKGGIMEVIFCYQYPHDN